MRTHRGAEQKAGEEGRLPPLETLYQAFLERDSRFEGLFVVAVRTTGVFCRPTCRARKPRRENVEFLPTPSEALQRGYRPCRVCCPLDALGEVPPDLRPIVTAIEAGQKSPSDSELHAEGVDPDRARRWFKAHYGMTFHAYCRVLRLSRAFRDIREGQEVAPAAFATGYSSLSGFSSSFKRATGLSPRESRDRALVVVTRLLTPLGPMIAGATEEGICLLEFADRRMLDTQLARVRRLLSAEILPGTSPHLVTLEQELQEYFGGARRQFDLPLVLRGTPFQERVWRELLTIPYGTTRSYQVQADRLGTPQAVRAVARANGDNRIAILVPCHRVIGKDGKLTGYGGGLWRKEHLLHLERADGERGGNTPASEKRSRRRSP